jgi:hypothetical protein
MAGVWSLVLGIARSGGSPLAVHGGRLPVSRRGRSAWSAPRGGAGQIRRPGGSGAARAWLERSGLTAVLPDSGDGRLALEVRVGQHDRAEGILQAVAGTGRLADLPPTPRWQRIPTWENLAGWLAMAVGLLLAVVLVVGFGGLLRWLGVGGAVALCVAGLLYVAYSGRSAADEDPEPVSPKHGVITQDDAVIVPDRRAWIRRTWALTNGRKRRRHTSDSPPASAPRSPDDAGAPSPRRISSRHIPGHRCERFVDAGCERCHLRGAPRPGRP